MAFNNRNNLSPESAPWGREVEQKIETNAYDLNRLRLVTESNNKATNGTLGVLSAQQSQLQATQTTLSEQQIVLSDQQAQLQATQQRASETTTVIARTSTYNKSGGAASGQVAEYETTVNKPSWATFAIVQVITSNVTGTFTPASGSGEEPEITAFSFASASTIPNSIDFDNWRVAWFISPYEKGGAAQAFAVNVSGTSTLYLKQRVNYLATATASISAVQAFSILWV